MVSKIFVNLPVKDLNRSKVFFSELGFEFNSQFTDDNAACLILGENIFAMLLTEKFFKNFTNKEIADAQKTTEVLLAIDTESREKVDEIIKSAVKNGGSIYKEKIDNGWMYQHSFADPDGHQWEVMYLDEKAVPASL